MNTPFFIQNLKCGGCAATIERTLRKFPEILQVKVDFDNSVVHIESTEAQPDKYAEALRQIGYPPAGEDNSLFDRAKSLVSCVAGRVF